MSCWGFSFTNVLSFRPRAWTLLSSLSGVGYSVTFAVRPWILTSSVSGVGYYCTLCCQTLGIDAIVFVIRRRLLCDTLSSVLGLRLLFEGIVFSVRPLASLWLIVCSAKPSATLDTTVISVMSGATLWRSIFHVGLIFVIIVFSCATLWNHFFQCQDLD